MRPHTPKGECFWGPHADEDIRLDWRKQLGVRVLTTGIFFQLRWRPRGVAATQGSATIASDFRKEGTKEFGRNEATWSAWDTQFAGGVHLRALGVGDLLAFGRWSHLDPGAARPGCGVFLGPRHLMGTCPVFKKGLIAFDFHGSQLPPTGGEKDAEYLLRRACNAYTVPEPQD